MSSLRCKFASILRRLLPPSEWPRQGRALGQREAGYTLIEILIVLSIIALIAAVVGPRVIGYLGRAKTSTAKVQITELATALELYFLDNGKFPSEQTGLQALVTRPTDAKTWNGPYLKKAEGLTDPWGRPFLYKLASNGGAFEISSLGADNAPGGEGDDADVSSR